MTQPEVEALLTRIVAGEHNSEVTALTQRALGIVLRGFSEFAAERSTLMARIAELEGVASEGDVDVDDDGVEDDNDAFGDNSDDYEEEDEENEPDAEGASDDETPPPASHKKK